MDPLVPRIEDERFESLVSPTLLMLSQELFTAGQDDVAARERGADLTVGAKGCTKARVVSALARALCMEIYYCRWAR